MMYINLRELEALENWPPGNLEHLKLIKYRKRKLTPEQWKADLARANAELRSLPIGKKYSKIFETYSYLWSDVKKCYTDISHGKCWYCERKVGPADGNIDHYRPKGKVTENPSHPGYWWLAFDWRNWRFACKLCNSKNPDYQTGKVGGKGTDFPILGNDESRRVWNECNFEDLALEYPALLDPTKEQDVDLLTFTRDGRAGSTTDDEQSPDYQRVRTSITAYHLDHSKLVKERQTLYYKVLKSLTRCHSKLTRCKENPGDLQALNDLKDAYVDLHELLSDENEYSAAIKAYLIMHRNDDLERGRIIDHLLKVS